MDRGTDRHLQRIIQNAGSYDIQNGRNTNIDQDQVDTTGWTFGAGPGSRQPPQETPTFNGNLGHDLLDTRQPLQLSSTGRNRLSLLPQNMYSQPRPQPELEPRTITNAENHFRFAQNLRQGVPLNQATQRDTNFRSVDPISPLATAMLSQQQMPQRQLQLDLNRHQPLPFTQAPSRLNIPALSNFKSPSASNMLTQQLMLQRQPSHPPQSMHRGLQESRLNQLQPQRQQVTPPFNLNSFTSPHVNRTSRSSSPPVGQGSSPSARVSLRRATNRAAPSNDYHGSEYEQDVDIEDAMMAPTARDVPRTPQQLNPYSTAIYTPTRLNLSHAPPRAHGIQLVSPLELPDRLRQVFPYELFNAVQSKCFAPIFKGDDNVVVSAPTGSGKTALLELAICRTVHGHPGGQFKIVYLAPTKSLCSERMRDWSKKFSHLNLQCAELTGDTSQSEMAKVRDATVIVTTPEKWDSITRKWTDHQKLVQMVKLFLIDEVHILKESRGATLEAVVSRMKTMSANVRFVALSATVPNSDDIALWLGKDHTSHHVPAHRETFGEDFRPVKLQKHIEDFDGSPNDFAFEKVLNGKLPSLVKKYSQKKPIMVFCNTRKSCENTANILAEWWTRLPPTERAWRQPLKRVAVGSKELQALVSCGVAFHHAGLDLQDRHAIESAYLKGDVNVICCTSTLAVGVNLPCHLVVLKGTVGFQDGRVCEYSDLEVMQMLGRAGRPQFDDTAVAVIMTRKDKADRYRKMVSGQDVLESTLHLNLIEHLNSEISLRTIKNIYDAKKWLGGTFLSVRMRQNPNHYKIDGVTPGGDTDRRLEQVCERNIKLLQEHDLVTDDDRIDSTEYGAAMSRYMVQFETMKLLLSIPRQAKTEKILHTICQAAEFRDLRMKPNERPYLRELNKSPSIKFPIKEPITTTPHKVSLLIQIQLGGVDYPTDKDFNTVRRQFATDKGIIFERVQRLIRCVIDCKTHDCDSVSTRHALDLARSLSAEFWENSNLQLRQIPQFGPVAVRKLVTNNVQSVHELGKMETSTIERLISKNPPFGRKTRELISGFPDLGLAAEITKRAPTKVGEKLEVHVTARMWYGNATTPVWKGRKPSLTFMAETSEGVLVHFWRGNVFKLVKDFDLRFAVELSVPDSKIKCWIACEEIVGTVKSCVLKPDIPASEFPTLPAPVEAKERTKNNKLRDESQRIDEFGTDDLDDDDMLAAVGVAETAKSDYGSDDFIDIDDVELGLNVKPDKSKKTKEPENLEPFQMANGKWTCNHVCRDGQLLKNGQNCKHLCCREGLDKPRKLKRKSSSGLGGAESASSKRDNTQGEKKLEKKKIASRVDGINSRVSARVLPKLKLHTYDSDLDDVEVIDLAEELTPVPYSKLAPRDYRKLHALHGSVQNDVSIRRINPNPQFSYASGKGANLPFLETDKDGIPASDAIDSDDDNLFPSPSALLEKHVDAYDYEEDPFAEEPFSSAKDVGAPARVPVLSVEDEYMDESMDGLEAAMIDLSDASMLKPPTPTPKIGSSFGNDMFDFAAFDDNDPKLEVVSASSSGAPQDQNQASSSISKLTEKRQRAATPDLPELKYRRVTEPVVDVSSVPAWVSDFDSELIDGLKDFVDFVDFVD